MIFPHFLVPQNLATAKLKNQLLAEKLETDLLLRFANTTQISDAIKNVGLSSNQNFILIAIGNKSLQKKLSEMVPDLIFLQTTMNSLQHFVFNNGACFRKPTS